MMRGFTAFILILYTTSLLALSVDYTQNTTGFSPGDPNSYSRPELVKTTHIHLDLDVDFDNQILLGTCTLSMEKVDLTVTSVILDYNTLNIESIKLETTGEELNYTISKETGSGSSLEIMLPPGTNKIFKLVCMYSTTPESSALQWLTPEQTAGGTHPYMFSQCEAIHCRSMLPCQDSPSVKYTYSANITAPEGITVLMSALRKQTDEAQNVVNGKLMFYFDQPIPVQSYLITIAAGALKSKKIGPRSHVWTEEKYLELAASDFSETEAMLKTAEELSGPYVWGIYDILVLPPTFPYGGMENPCLTFVSPTLLSGDKANANVIAHEIAHSWTGNLVTNFNFEHFWLNEGFTRFVEGKILGRLHGNPARHLNALIRWPTLEETVNEVFGVDNPLTKLVVDLKGKHPDDAFSSIPYEKGLTLLWYLEELVGGADEIEPFLRAYYNKFMFKSIHSDDFKMFFLEYFSNVEAVKEIDWDTWFYSPGMPPYKPVWNDSLVVTSRALAKIWLEWNPNTRGTIYAATVEEFSGGQLQDFLNTVLDGAPLPVSALEKMEELYKLNESTNVEITYRWIRVGIKARWSKIVPRALKLVTEVGRLKYIRPIYRDLYKWEEVRQQAIDTFNQNKHKMMKVSRDMIAADLKLTEEADA